MSEYTEVEQPFLHQLQNLGWDIIDQGQDIPADPGKSQRLNFRQWLLPEVFARSVAALNTTADGYTWLSDKQLQDLQDQILRQPNRTLLEANEAIHKLLFKVQVDVNETTGEQDPVVKLIDYAKPENNHFLAINQFRVDTPGGVKQFIIPDIVLFVNGIPLAVVECKKGGPNCANPLSADFEQLQPYMNQRKATQQQGLKEGEPRLFHCNLLLIRTTGVEADYGTITSGDEHFYPWKTQWPQPDSAAEGMNQQQQLISGMLNKANLLGMLRTSSVFMDTDSGPRIKVVCRYQQFRAANKIIERLRHGQSVEEKSGTTLQILYEGRTADAALIDKHDFETKFENLFKDRSDEELLAIKKKYGATGDLLEAEQRIAAIAKDMVRHYLQHIFPNGFKAQVVCHSKLAAVGYQQAIDLALADALAELETAEEPDAEMIRKMRFLKVAVVISGDGTNEAAYITEARKQARAWNAVDNFCKPFAFDDLDKPYTGIAFLVVCDMLLTGFDAPIEQVMYLDKKIREHTLLQAIARTKRVKKGKKRGYVVDYIGLTRKLDGRIDPVCRCRRATGIGQWPEKHYL